MYFDTKKQDVNNILFYLIIVIIFLYIYNIYMNSYLGTRPHEHRCFSVVIGKHKIFT